MFLSIQNYQLSKIINFYINFIPIKIINFENYQLFIINFISIFVSIGHENYQYFKIINFENSQFRRGDSDSEGPGRVEQTFQKKPEDL